MLVLADLVLAAALLPVLGLLPVLAHLVLVEARLPVLVELVVVARVPQLMLRRPSFSAAMARTSISRSIRPLCAPVPRSV